MNLAQMRHFDVANGIGIRASLFVSGCTHNCKGCFNKDYQNFKYGNTWTLELENEFLTYVKDENVKGVTILGGEPMEQTMDNDLVNLLKRIKEETNKNIWIYSGYTFEEIIKDQKKVDILKECDVLVDGKFIQELKDFRLRFRGSSNQRIIDVKKSLQSNSVVLYQL